jgi:hypothetical protein
VALPEDVAILLASAINKHFSGVNAYAVRHTVYTERENMHPDVANELFWFCLGATSFWRVYANV